MSTVRVGTYNVHHSVDPEKTGADVWRLAGQFDVLILNEVGRPQFQQVMDNLPPGWREVPAGRGAETTIIYNTHVAGLNGAHAFLAAHGRHVRPAKGFASHIPDRHGLAATFHLLDGGDVFSVVGGHPPAHIEAHGHPRGDAPERVAMAQDYIESMARVSAELRRLGAVITGGDFNIDWAKDHRARTARFPEHVFGAIGGHAHWTAATGRLGGTAGRRLIDTLYGIGARAVEGSVWTGKRFYSDHRPTGATWHI